MTLSGKPPEASPYRTPLVRLFKADTVSYLAVNLATDMARGLAEHQGLAPLMTATAVGWRRDLGQAFDATVAAIKNKPVGMALTVCMPLPGATARMTELVGLYVAPPFRRRGIGTALVRHVLAEARAGSTPNNRPIKMTKPLSLLIPQRRRG